MFEYISPFYEVTVGSWHVRKAVRLDVFSARTSPVDLAEIEFDTLGEAVAIQKADPVEIKLGYREKGLWLVFRGSVHDVSAKRTTTIWAKDRMEGLRGVHITQAFVDVSAAEVIRFVADKVGIADMRLGSDQTPKKHHFILNGQNVVDAVKLVNRTWGLDWDFYFEPEGTFVWESWGESRRQQELITFELGKNILDLTPKSEGHGELNTILLPFIRHSNLIQIEDGRFWQETVKARVERLHHSIADGKARTRLEWELSMNA